MTGARLFASALAIAAVGCLWLFPIEEKPKTNSSTTAMTMAGSNDMTGGAAGAPAMNDSGEPGCTSTVDCIFDHFICKTATQTCLELVSPECPVVKGRWDDPNAFFFGAYATEQVGAPAEGQAIYNYALAIDELNMMGGLPDKDGVRHPLAAVICNNDPKMALDDPEFYHRSLDHLVNTLGVSAIVADLAPATLEDAFKRTQMPPKKDVFFLSPGAANKALLALGDNGLVWNMLGPPKDLAPGYANLVQRIEKFVDKDSDGGTTTLRVALVANDDPNEVDHQLLGELLEAVRPQLFFNGASATSQMNGNYREFVIDKTSDAGVATAAGAAINLFAPHIVISMTGKEFTDTKKGVVSEIVTKVSGAGGAERTPWLEHQYPFFIGSPINAAAAVDFNAFLQSPFGGGTYPVLYERFLGINIAGTDDRDLYKLYVSRLRKFEETTVVGYENYYDSIYYLAYSIYVEGVEKALDGHQLSTGMARMSNGMVFKVGPLDIEPVFEALKSRDGSIKLIGTGGSLFDVSNGVRTDLAGLYCFEKNGNSIPLPHEPAEIFDAMSQTWKVIFQCTPGL